jgi:hypothetical protein
MSEAVRFSDSVTVRMPEGATAFVQAKAREVSTKPAEIARQALLGGLRSIGFDPATITARGVSALHDSQNGDNS